MLSGQAQVAQKSGMIKHIWIQWKISEQICFSEKAQVAQKSWMIKIMYSIQWEISEQLWFSEQAQVLKNL